MYKQNGLKLTLIKLQNKDVSFIQKKNVNARISLNRENLSDLESRSGKFWICS